MPIDNKQMSQGFIFQQAWCNRCLFRLDRDKVIRQILAALTQPQQLKENIVAQVRQLHNGNCESGLVIVYNQCLYDG